MELQPSMLVRFSFVLLMLIVGRIGFGLLRFRRCSNGEVTPDTTNLLPCALVFCAHSHWKNVSRRWQKSPGRVSAMGMRRSYRIEHRGVLLSRLRSRRPKRFSDLFHEERSLNAKNITEAILECPNSI